MTPERSAILFISDMAHTARYMLWVLPALLAVVVTGCVSPPAGPVEAPQVSIADLRLDDLTFFEQHYRVRLRVKNPNPFAVRVTGMAFTLKVNNMDFARGVSSESVTLPAYGEELLDVKVTSDLANVVEQINARRNSPGEPLRYELTGHVSVSGVPDRIGFSHRGTLGNGR